MRKMDRKIWGKGAVFFLICVMILSGCGQKNGNEALGAATEQKDTGNSGGAEENDSEKNESGKSGIENSGRSDNGDQNAWQQGFAVIDGKLTIGDMDILFEDEDASTDWDRAKSAIIHLDGETVTVDGKGASAEGNVVTISKAGNYVLEGTLTDGTVRVDCDDKETVRLILNGVTIHSETSAAIDIVDAHKTIITLADGTVNTLSDSAGFSYRNTEKEEPNAVLFSKDDLTINGSGTLAVEAVFNNGIQCKDILKIMGGKYEITTVNHGIKGNDALAVVDGEMQISAEGDGLKSDTALTVLGGTVNVARSEEGMEAETIVIGGGTIDITSTDDGINASTDGTAVPAIYIGGGSVTVRAEGDGLDANGSIYMCGGEVTVHGPEKSGNGAIDYDREFLLTGGVLAAFGPGGMDQAIGDNSSQPGIMMVFDGNQPAGTKVNVKDENGNVLYGFTGEKTFRTAVISVPEFQTDGNYQLESSDVTVAFTLKDMITYLNKDGVADSAVMAPGGRGGKLGGRGERPEGQEFPDGERPPKGQRDSDREMMPEGRGFSDGERPPEGERPARGQRFSEEEMPQEGERPPEE